MGPTVKICSGHVHASTANFLWPTVSVRTDLALYHKARVTLHTKSVTLGGLYKGFE